MSVEKKRFLKSEKKHKYVFSNPASHQQQSTVNPTLNPAFIARLLFESQFKSNHDWHLPITGQYYYYHILDNQCLQCFDAVGWAAGRGSGL